jgi:UDP-GlcNAc:undecaprenyl-phosphate GlcNAc-1-phosphate transferase
MIKIVIFVASLFSALLAVPLIRKVALHFRIGALPNARKIHKDFIPLLGGLGIFTGLVIGVLAANIFNVLPFNSWISQKFFWIGLLIILATGLIDDIRGMNAWQKFTCQFLAAGLAVLGGCSIEAFYSPGGATLELGRFTYPFSILWIMFVINSVNLLDGLDGLASGISLIISGGILVIAMISGNIFLVVLAIALIGGILGFLRFNYHPAKIFMGDVGSLMLGYLLACFSVEALKVAKSHQVYFLVSLTLLGMPITDTLISFFRRMGRGDHPFKPDREHIHHRLLKLGVSHLDSVWMMYYFTLLYVVLAVLMVLYWDRVTGITLFSLTFVFSIFWAWRLGYLETRRYITLGIQEQETRASIRPPIHVGRIWHQIALLFGDILAIGVSFLLTVWFRLKSGVIQPPSNKPLDDYLNQPVLFILIGAWLLLFWLNGLYRMSWDVSRFDKSLRVMKVITFGMVFILVLMNLNLLIGPNLKDPLNPSQILTLAFYWLAMVILVNGIRLLIINFEKRLHLFEYSYKNTLLIGTTRQARNIIRDIEGNPHLLNKIIGIVDRNSKTGEFQGYPLLGDYQDLPQLIQRHKIEEIIVAVSENTRQDLLDIVGVCDRLQVIIKTLPALQTIVSSKTPELAGHSLVRVFPENMVAWQLVVKRFIDLFFAISLLVLTFPLWLTFALLIKLDFRKSVIVKLPILGKNGRVFTMYLFRLGGDCQLSNEIYQGAGENHQLTSLGDFLYRTRLYKFPQLINILKGDMSIVGPRPEPPEWYRKNQHSLRFLHRRLTVRPGITGIAQLKYRFYESPKMLPERIKYDIFYSENSSINLDLRIILRSIFLFFRWANR